MQTCSFNIIDINRLWLKSKQNVAESEFDRRYTVCTHVILDDAPHIVVIPDLHEDERFRSWLPNWIRFYAGCPVVVEGYKIGVLCVLDSTPHNDFDTEKQRILLNIAALISSKVTEQYHSQLTARSGRPEQLVMNMVYSLKHPLRIIEELNRTAMRRFYEREETERTDFTSLLKNVKDLQSSMVELGALVETSIYYAHTNHLERCMLYSHLQAVQHTLQCLLVPSGVLQELIWQSRDLSVHHAATMYDTYPYVLKQVLLCAVFNLSVQWKSISVDLQTPPAAVVSASSISENYPASSTPKQLHSEGLRIVIVAQGHKEMPLRGARRVRHEIDTGLMVVSDLVQSVGGVFTRSRRTGPNTRCIDENKDGTIDEGATLSLDKDSEVESVQEKDIPVRNGAGESSETSNDSSCEMFFIHFPCSAAVEG